VLYNLAVEFFIQNLVNETYIWTPLRDIILVFLLSYIFSICGV